MGSADSLILFGWLGGVLLTFCLVAFGLWFAFLRGRARDPIPGWNARTKNCPFLPVDMAQALNAFIGEWSDAFGPEEAERIRAMLNQKRFFGLVRFSIAFKLVIGRRYYTLKHPSGNITAAGHMANPRHIVVAHLYDDSIGATALFHELTHPSLLLLSGAADNNHAEPPGPWKDLHDAMIRRLKIRFNAVFPPASVPKKLDHAKALNAISGNPDDEGVVCGTCSRPSSEFE